MKKTFILISVLILIGLGGAFAIFGNKGQTESVTDLTSPETSKVIEPSSTSIDYTDPSGFSFSYPDNISLAVAEIEDPDTYTDLQLFSKDISGSLKFKITETKFKSIDEWLKENKISESEKIEKKLGELDAVEVKTIDRLFLGAIDQGVLFTIEMPLIEQNFWTVVYDKLLTGFTFATPVAAGSGSVSAASSDEVIFEGEEVIE